MLAAGKIGVCFVDVGTSATSVPCALPTDSERVPPLRQPGEGGVDDGDLPVGQAVAGDGVATPVGRVVGFADLWSGAAGPDEGRRVW